MRFCGDYARPHDATQSRHKRTGTNVIAVSYGTSWDHLGRTAKRWLCEFPDPKTGLFQVEWRENGRRLTRSLKHRDWRRAKRQADEFAAGFVGPEIGGEAEAKPERLTLKKLFDIYGEEVTPTKGWHSRGHDRAAMHMFLRFFGRNRDPATLSQRVANGANHGKESRKVSLIGTARSATLADRPPLVRPYHNRWQDGPNGGTPRGDARPVYPRPKFDPFAHFGPPRVLDGGCVPDSRAATTALRLGYEPNTAPRHRAALATG